MEKVNQKQNFLKGIFQENPTFVVMLGMCPTLAVTTKLESAIGMGISVIFVLLFSNMIVSAIKNFVPSDIRIPVYIVVIATLVSIVEMIMQAYFPALYKQLGIFVALIVVNCIILGRAEAFASKNNIVSSAIDALGMGIGFTLAISLVSIVRELLGHGTITVWGDFVINLQAVPEFLHISPSPFFTSNAGAFVVLGILIGSINAISIAIKNKKNPKKEVAR